MISEAAETAAGLRQEIGHWPHAGDGDDIYVSLALVRKAASLLDRLDAAEKVCAVADALANEVEVVGSPALGTFDRLTDALAAWEALRDKEKQ
jgi:hypothetical protein